MSKPKVAIWRFLVVTLAGYFSLATSAPPPDWTVRAAHVDVPLDPSSSRARISVTLDAEAVIILAPEALGIESSSGIVWTPEDGSFESEGYCEDYHRMGTFCEEVPGGSGTFEYEVSMAAGPAGTTGRIEVLAGGILERLNRSFGLSLEVLP
jgi:hypothetical protein